MGSDKILCARCAAKQGLDWTPENSYLRLCTECQVEQWCNRYGTGDYEGRATEDEIREAHERASREAKERRAVVKMIRQQRRDRREQEVKEAKEAVKND